MQNGMKPFHFRFGARTEHVNNACTRRPVRGHRDEYPSLAPVALDLVWAPASHACTECIFSVCGDLTAGKRNRTEAALQRGVFLKLT